MNKKYFWIISIDHLSSDSPADCAAGRCGGDPKVWEMGNKENTHTFKMYDDDDILYYEGTITGNFTGFEPLDDFGEGNAGCTRIDIDGKTI